MFDIGAVTRIKSDWQAFLGNHPKIGLFINNIRQKGSCSGQEIAIAIRYPDGTEFKTGIRLTDSDLNLLHDIAGLTK